MSNKIAFIYPGQGAQKVGMGKTFYDQYPEAKAVYDDANEVLDFDLLHVCFEENEQINETAYTQPALVATSLAITKVLQDKGITPEVTAGLSLGEYSAIAAAGGMEATDAIRLVRARGTYMEQAVPNHKGAMSAVLGLTGEEIQEQIKDIPNVWIANYNCPGQVAITGETESVKAAGVKLKDAGSKRVIPLAVSGPFHCPMMEPAAEQLLSELMQIPLQELEIPYISNVTAQQVERKEKIIELLTTQMTHSVLWEQSVRQMIADGVDTFVEVGPGRTLSNFIKKIDKTVKTYQIGTVEEMEQVIGELVCKENK